MAHLGRRNRRDKLAQGEAGERARKNQPLTGSVGLFPRLQEPYAITLVLETLTIVLPATVHALLFIGGQYYSRGVGLDEEVRGSPSMGQENYRCPAVCIGAVSRLNDGLIRDL